MEFKKDENKSSVNICHPRRKSMYMYSFVVLNLKWVYENHLGELLANKLLGSHLWDSNSVNWGRETAFWWFYCANRFGCPMTAIVNWLDYIMKSILAKTDFSEDRKKIENGKIGEVYQFGKIDTVS